MSESQKSKVIRTSSERVVESIREGLSTFDVRLDDAYEDFT